MLYMVCLAYFCAVFWVAYRCACCYQALVIAGFEPNRRTFVHSIMQALKPSQLLSMQYGWALARYHRYVCCVAVALVLVVLSTFMYRWAFLASTLNASFIVLLGWHAWVVTLLIFLSCIDLKSYLLPDVLCLPLLLSAVLMGWFFPTIMDVNSVLSVLWVAVLAYGAYVVGRYVADAPLIGLGDVKLYIALVACLPTLKAALFSYLFACLSCWLVQLIWQRRWLPQGSCAFGPYLCIGYLISILGLPALQ